MPDASWSLDDRPGWPTLRAAGPSLDRPGYTSVGRRQQHLDCRVSARIDPGSGRGGLCVRMDEAHHYELEVSGGEAAGPDTLAFSVVGTDTALLAELDGRYLSTQLSTGFTGRVIGMYAIEGSVAFDWFDYTPATLTTQHGGTSGS
ncbi:hypothetical protein [Streptomyces sp. NPDC021224]|uniref:beta-xylosidase family glycoside hydrolase n=1 Tax=unclassified Streptomyces TaxID=2593676 RepID=UPI003795A1B2